MEYFPSAWCTSFRIFAIEPKEVRSPSPSRIFLAGTEHCAEGFFQNIFHRLLISSVTAESQLSASFLFLFKVIIFLWMLSSLSFVTAISLRYAELFTHPGIWASWICGLVPYLFWKILSKYHLWFIPFILRLKEVWPIYWILSVPLFPTILPFSPLLGCPLCC